MTSFCKSEDCPSSNILLEYQRNELPREHSSEVREHLSSCEFCSAEVEFYSHYPLDENAPEHIEQGFIPAPLYELAEALLKKRHTDTLSLDTFLNAPAR